MDEAGLYYPSKVYFVPLFRCKHGKYERYSSLFLFAGTDTTVIISVVRDCIPVAGNLGLI